MILNLKTEETTLSTNTTVSSARCVRVYNGHTAAVLITVQTDANTAVGSFTMQANTVEIVEKAAAEEMSANNNGASVKVVNIGFSIS